MYRNWCTPVELSVRCRTQHHHAEMFRTAQHVGETNMRSSRGALGVAGGGPNFGNSSTTCWPPAPDNMYALGGTNIKALHPYKDSWTHLWYDDCLHHHPLSNERRAWVAMPTTRQAQMLAPVHTPRHRGCQAARATRATSMTPPSSRHMPTRRTLRRQHPDASPTDRQYAPRDDRHLKPD